MHNIQGSLYKTQKKLAASDAKFFGNKGRETRATNASRSNYLLAGLMLCGECGNSLIGDWKLIGPKGSKHKEYYYRCNTHKKAGTAHCHMNLKPDMAELDGVVLEYFADHLLTPGTIKEAISKAQQRVREALKQKPDRPRKLAAEIDKTQVEIDRFVARIADGSAPDAITSAIRDREDWLQMLRQELGQITRPHQDTIDSAEMLATLEERLGDFRSLLLENKPKARQVLSELLKGPLMFGANENPFRSNVLPM